MKQKQIGITSFGRERKKMKKASHKNRAVKLKVVIDIAILVLCGRQLEPLWGALELLKYLAILDAGVSGLTTLACLVAYMASPTRPDNVSIWFTPFGGMAGIIGGVIVAFKQIMPDHKLDGKIAVLRVQNIPGLILLLDSILAIIQLVPATQPIMFASGMIIGWVYLRFYQPRGKGLRGDMSEGFEFASFFPEPARSPVRIVSLIVFNLLVKTGICKNPVRTYDVGAPSAITISLPGVNPADAERRRKKALRALNERLSKHKTEPNVEDEETEWPTMEEENRHETSEPKENELTEVVSDSSKNELAKESEETSNSNENNTGPT